MRKCKQKKKEEQYNKYPLIRGYVRLLHVFISQFILPYYYNLYENSEVKYSKNNKI